ncbi:MAG: hypothetical protein HRU41_39585 [Saprospiraceae bacterium]|nr:hypothetical protein [Saprospiraceae bacterium]
MKTTLFLTSLLFLLATACLSPETPQKETQSRLDLIPEPDKDLRLKYEQNQAFLEMDGDSLWEYLVFQKGGCLTGGQYLKGGAFGGRTCVMSAADEWEIFLNRPRQAITDLLLSKLADTSTTKIHTCPYFNASEGEVAIYALQRLYKTDWFDFVPFQSYRDSLGTGATNNPQAWLQALLQKDDQREVLLSNWQQQANK